MKKVMIIGLLLIVFIAGVLVFGASKLGPLIKTAVNTYGPQLTKTELRLGDVSISLLSGTAELRDFFLGNPQGFASPEAVRVGSISIDIDKKSIAGDTIIIHSIEVIAPAITYEKKRGTDNFQAIANNVSSGSSRPRPAKDSAKQEQKSEPGKNILIENFILKQGTVTLAASLAGGTVISATLPDIHLKNIGGQGASPQQVFAEILMALHQQVTSATVTDVLNQRLKELEKNLGGSLRQQADSVKDTVKGIFGK
ncbi:MAG: AsmA family protein [Deltaproteobacteria bacterium]|nr:AsmA family protein [Deltaproteobacteria bacterium]